MVSDVSPSSSLPAPVESPEVARALDAARRLLFDEGYQGFTMDQLAHELGISKKTLYVHFPSKDAILEGLIDRLGWTIQTGMRAVLDNPHLGFTQKVSGVVGVAGSTLARVSPSALRDLQRFAPAIYQRIEDIRLRVIPAVFGELIRTGMREGKVRADLDPSFATEFWLQAIRGLVQPAALERTQLSIPQTLQQALNLFFAGLLTAAGRKDYEKHA